MKQTEIDRAVARTTGESRRTIAGRGFSLDRPSPPTAASLEVGLDCPGCGHPVPLHSDTNTQPWNEAECERCDAVYDVAPGELTVIERAAVCA